jgi:hypothetical protein
MLLFEKKKKSLECADMLNWMTAKIKKFVSSKKRDPNHGRGFGIPHTGQ